MESSRGRWASRVLIPFLAVTLLVVASCGSGGEAGDSASDPVAGIEDSTQRKLLEVVMEDETLPGASVRIVAPSQGLDWGTGVGYADADGAVPFTSAHPIRISSVTKPFLAAAVLRLHEQGRLDIDASISRYLTPEHAQILSDGPYDPDEVTVRHLLTHTSGIVDTFSTASFVEYFESVLGGAEPKRFTLEDQVLAAVNGGDPTGAPGERQDYTDTGYILLGAILEAQTGQNMATVVSSESRYGEIGLQNTWWEFFEEPPAGALLLAKQYYGAFDAEGFGRQPYDLYGGGGMISSADDLARYFWMLFHDEIFEDPATLDLMESHFYPENYEGDGELLIRHGLEAYEIDGKTFFGHGGWWGVRVYFSPEEDVLVVVNWLQQRSSRQMDELARSIVSDVVEGSVATAGD